MPTIIAMELKTWLQKERGRRSELAAYLGIKPPQVSDWTTGLQAVPIVHMAAIEAFTNGEVTRQEMCPDRWPHIWPELAQTNPAAAQQTSAQAAPEAVAAGGD